MADQTTPPIDTSNRNARAPSPGMLTHSHSVSHRSSFAESIRHSPRAQRHLSFTQAAVQELLNHPQNSKMGDPRFIGRDWRSIRVGELVRASDVRFCELDTSVEQATKILVESGPPNVVMIRETPTDTVACGTFDYNDLNNYLLIVVGLASPEDGQVEAYEKVAKDARAGTPIPIRDVHTLAKKAPIVTLSQAEDLSKAVEIFGSGVHRILVCKEGTSDVVGIFSQLRLVQFLWENGSSFPAIDALYPLILRDLDIGTIQTIAINGDRPLTDALQLMNNEGITSVAVVDNGLNVIGNISAADVRLLTNSSSLPLLKSTCIHFISVILTERGVEDGKDSFPVFYVNPYSTLAHTVAKLIATKSHRMWLVESASPSPSQPATPSLAHAVLGPQTVSGPTSPSLSGAFPAVSAASLPGQRTSGRLIGVVSLTDILNLFARQSGLNPLSPESQRARRRRSSSSSVRPSLDSVRGSGVSIELKR